MLRYIGVLIIAIVFVIVVVVFKFLSIDEQKQNIAIKGQQYRREYGAFVFKKYVENTDLIKGKDWLKQKNKGIIPRKYKKRIEYKNHDIKDCDLIVKRGF